MNTIEFTKLDEEFILKNNNEKICVLKKGIDYYFKLNLKFSSDKVVVFSNGAVDRSKSELPVFMRHTWSDDINASCIFVDDRTIHDSKLSIGWGIGNKETYYLDEMGMIIRRILKLLGCKNSHTYYFGSSAGGMMSMILATKHMYSNAIVNNPQMFTYNFMKGTHLNYIRNKYFSEYNPEEFRENFKLRLSVPDLIIEKGYMPRTIYILNKLSPTDYEEQFLPFTKALEASDINTSKIEYILYNSKGLGHNPLSKERTIRLINATLDGALF